MHDTNVCSLIQCMKLVVNLSNKWVSDSRSFVAQKFTEFKHFFIVPYYTRGKPFNKQSNEALSFSSAFSWNSIRSIELAPLKLLVMYISEIQHVANLIVNVQDRQTPSNRHLQQVPLIQPAERHKLCHPLNLYHSYSLCLHFVNDTLPDTNS